MSERDIDRLKTLLTDWGVVFDGHGEYEPPTDGAQWVVVKESWKDPKRDGYNGFFTCFEFDADGSFIKMGAWE